MRYFVTALAALIIAAAIPTAAFADYAYTFQVPATLSNLPAGSGIQVECSMYAGKNGSGGQLSTQTSGSPVAPTNGAYSGTFTVRESSATAPGSYACWLLVYTGNTLLNIVNGNPSNATSGWTGTMLTTGNLGS